LLLNFENPIDGSLKKLLQALFYIARWRSYQSKRCRRFPTYCSWDRPLNEISLIKVVSA